MNSAITVQTDVDSEKLVRVVGAGKRPVQVMARTMRAAHE
jgi:hypothetical protein